MGYNSKVRIGTTNEGFEFIKEYVAKKIGEDAFNSSYMNSCIVIPEKENIIFFGWDWINFYNELIEVKAIYEALDYMEERDIPYKMMVIGEEYSEYGSVESTEYDPEDVIPYMYTTIDIVYDSVSII